ncbi:hypothetical protein [Kocuria sp.]|uniref:hypothetical protein n=1 Tax=Kocuria sp. TaxID=1871328 RepID=UPI0026E06A1E|nr:hypothetical protein [Kocuria sp.]MDO5619565.1 hypothetical protein [Kocuria sp.]
MNQNASEQRPHRADPTPETNPSFGDWHAEVVHALLNPSGSSSDQPQDPHGTPEPDSDDGVVSLSAKSPAAAQGDPADGAPPGKQVESDAGTELAVAPVEPRNRRERRQAEKLQVATTRREENLVALRTQLKLPSARRGRRVSRRWVGAFSRGVTSDTYPGDLERATRGVQQPVTTGRRIVVVSTQGGSGRSTTVAALAAIYGALRHDRVCAVDLTSAPSPLGDRLSVDTNVSPQQVIGSMVLNHPSTPAEMAQVFAQPRPGVWVTHAESQEEPLSELEVEELLTQVSRQCGVTVVECPPVLEDPRTQIALNLAHAVLVVGSATGHGLRNALTLHDFLAEDSDREHLPLATVINDHISDNPWSARDLRRTLEHNGRLHHNMSYDRHLSTSGDVEIDHLDERHRLEWVRLAATALTLARGYGVTP